MPLRQPHFAYGELAKAMWARTDLDAYNGGLRRCYNFFVAPQGALLNRPGTKSIKTWEAPYKPRLIPFNLSDDDTLVLAFWEDTISVIQRGAPVMDGPFEVEVATTYSTTDVQNIKYEQVGDVMTLTCPGHPARELIRTSSDSTTWELAECEFTPDDPSWSTFAPYVVTPLPVEDADHPAREWVWLVAIRVVHPTTGQLVESQAEKVASRRAEGDPTPGSATVNNTGDRFALGPDRAITITWPAGSAGSMVIDGVTCPAVSKILYRGRGRLADGLFGFVMETESNKFVDVGETPDYTHQPVRGRNPFLSEEPTCVAQFKQRLLFSGQSTNPRTVYGSKVGDFFNFDKKAGTLAHRTSDDAFEFELASTRADNVLWMRDMKELFVGTKGGVYTMSDLSALTAPNVLKQTEDGALGVAPLVVKDSLFYIRAKGAGINEIAFSNERGKHQVRPMNIYAPHLFKGKEISRWAYAQDPYSVIWAVMNDLSLLSFTYDRDFGTIAWCQHETEGSYYDVISVPEGEEDAVYFVTLRLQHNPSELVGTTQVYHLERMDSRNAVDDDWAGGLQDCCFLDCYISFDNTGAPTNELTGLSRFYGHDNIYAVADGQVLGPLTIDEDGEVNLGLAVPPSVVFVGFRYTSDIETLDYSPPKESQKDKEKMVVAVLIDVVQARGLWWGETLTGKMYEWMMRNVGAPPIPAYTGQVEAKPSSNWNRHGRVVLEQRDPTPLMIIGLERKVAVGT